MRTIITKLALVAGASVALAACGGSETTNVTENTVEMNVVDENAATDTTAVDANADAMAMNSMDSNMAMDNAMGMSNETNAM